MRYQSVYETITTGCLDCISVVVRGMGRKCRSQPAENPRVLIVSIDGLRPDLALRAPTPNLHRLMEEGSFSFWARTTALAVTLPSHTSMVTGVTPRKHEVEWNIDLPLSEPVYPKFPTLMELAHHHGYTTAMVCGKSKFTALARPGTLDWQFIPNQTHVEDPQVALEAVKIIREHQPQVMFVHFPSVDNVGHIEGWASAAQLEAIAEADRCLGQVLGALDEQKLIDRTFLIVTSDHGGAGRGHGPDDPRARHIPWIAVGPHVKKNLDLTAYADLVINTEDTFATCSRVLGIPLDHRLDGKPVQEIFVTSGEMLKDRE